MSHTANQPPDDEIPILAKVVDDTAAANPVDDSASRSDRDPKVPPQATADAVLPDDQDASQHTQQSGNPFASTGKEVRVGSPFASEPSDLWDDFLPDSNDSQPELMYDVGPLKYTAIGAVAAAVMVLAFAIAASWWFPGGGTLIAALGCALSIFGMYSPRKTLAAVCLLLHLGLFLFSYSRAIMI
ncbi:hypothetical protein [Planctomycetes bacterium K23_9]|uniref:Transmembrane protein n=1 Tax=Stieleria marina TaxID=1930275 RepID=A0A517NTK9_9BACT|nr:hypothetical protein K239x_24080 [Planctomycetes bacterium K23_9]